MRIPFLLSCVLHAVLACLLVRPAAWTTAPEEIKPEAPPPPAVSVKLTDAPLPAAPADADDAKRSQGAEAAGPVKISPVKSRFARPDGNFVHIGKNELKTGAEMTLALRSLADYDFTPDEFSGYYFVHGDPGRFLVVADTRRSRGGLLFYDSGTGLTRVMTAFAKYIYTYGPSLDVQKPVEGSVVFMARKDSELREHIDERSRLLWQPKTPPAVMATKITFREKTVSIPFDGERVPSLLVTPDGDGPYPGVVWLGRECPADTAGQVGLARALAARGLAVLVPNAACEGGTKLALAARKAMASQACVRSGATGFFGAGAQSGAALAALTGDSGPAFAVCGVGVDGPPPPAAALRSGARLLILSRGPAPSPWRAFGENTAGADVVETTSKRASPSKAATLAGEELDAMAAWIKGK